MWHTAIQRYVIGPHKGNGGAVCGWDGGVWGKSETLDATRDEVIKCRGLFKQLEEEPAAELTFELSRVTFRVDEHGMDTAGRQWISASAIEYHSGCTLIQTYKCLVIGYYDAPVTGTENLASTGALANIVEDLGN